MFRIAACAFRLSGAAVWLIHVCAQEVPCEGRPFPAECNTGRPIVRGVGHARIAEWRSLCPSSDSAPLRPFPWLAVHCPSPWQGYGYTIGLGTVRFYQAATPPRDLDGCPFGRSTRSKWNTLTVGWLVQVRAQAVSLLVVQTLMGSELIHSLHITKEQPAFDLNLQTLHTLL